VNAFQISFALVNQVLSHRQSDYRTQLLLETEASFLTSPQGVKFYPQGELCSLLSPGVKTLCSPLRSYM
jgi:hypothetical protein